MRGINIISMLIGFWGFNIFPMLAQTQVKPESVDNLICFWSFKNSAICYSSQPCRSLLPGLPRLAYAWCPVALQGISNS